MTAPKSEQDFWNNLVKTVAPGWISDFRATPDRPTPSMSTMQCWVYALDVQTGWTCGAGFEPAEVARLIKIGSTKERVNAAVEIAGESIIELGAANAPGTDERARKCLLASMCALGDTQLMKQVINTFGSAKGNFIYMAYALERGRPFARSAFAEQDKVGPMTLQDVLNVAAFTISKDLDNPSGFVGGQIRNGGGLIIAPRLKPLIDACSSQ